MKKFVKFTKHVKEEKEVEIDFPIYRKQPTEEASSRNWYYKVTEDLIEYGIHFCTSNRQEMEITIDRNVEFSGHEDYEFGLGKYTCTSAEFDKVWNEVLEELNAM